MPDLATTLIIAILAVMFYIIFFQHGGVITV